jgi:thiol-disulfide isomerase/thioredoxin
MSELPVLMTLECKGPGVPWESLTKNERITWFLFKERRSSDDFSICGESTVIIDTSVPDDFWPEYCPKCKTDINWSIEVVGKLQQLEIQLRGHMI